MKWYIVRGPILALTIVEQDDCGEDVDSILFPCECDARCPEGLHRVSKVYVGSSYFRSRGDAESRVAELTPVELVEPSAAERAEWPEATRAYVEGLEDFYSRRRVMAVKEA